MVVDPIWVGQYRFLQPLWAGKERIVFDPQLSAMLMAPGGVALPWDTQGQGQALLESMLAQDSGALWLLVPDLHEVAKAGVDPTRFGARALHDGPLLALRRSWDVAMVDVTGLLDSMLAGGDALAPEASLVDALLSSLTSQRHLLLWTRSRAGDPKRCKRWRALTRLLGSRNGPQAQAYAVGASAMMQVLPLEDEGASEAEIAVDRELGGTGENWSYLAYLGPGPSLGGCCIELPARPFEEVSDKPVKRSRSPLKQRLLAAQAELAQSEDARVALLEDLDRAGAQLADLHEQLEALRDCSEPAKVLAADEASSHALLLHATWEIERLRGQLVALRARPVSDLEAENAQLSAALAELQELVEARLASTPRGLSIPTDTGEPEKKDKDSAPKDAGEEAPVPRSQGPWSEELAKAQLSLAQTTQSVPSGWRDELKAMTAALQNLRASSERGDLHPLPLQQKLRELERSVQRLVRQGEAKDPGQASAEPRG